MFATLVGSYPRTPRPGRPFALRKAHAQLERGEIDESGFRRVEDELVREVIGEQIEAGLGLLTDGQVRGDDPQTVVARGLDGFEIAGLLRYFDTNTYYRQPRVVAEPRWRGPILAEDWRFADAAAREIARERGAEPRPVKACLVGPYTLARLSDEGDLGRERLSLALAEALREEIDALFDAGAPVVQVDENALSLIGRDEEGERGVALAALRRLTQEMNDERHLTLAVTMGSAAALRPDFFYELPFSSYLFDLVAGADNWRLIAYAPRERGIVCGVADARNTRHDDVLVMAWAARYAASISGRGVERVGLSPSTGLEYLPRDRARAKIESLAEAARLAAATDAPEVRRVIDPGVDGALASPSWAVGTARQARGGET